LEKEIKNLFLRKLDFASDTNAICQKGTKELQEYYESGDGEKIGLDEINLESGHTPDHITALINLISDEGDSGQNITDYIMHIIPVLIFLVIAILSLPGWLVCCICSCANCCCCCCCKKTFCKLPFYIITAVVYALVFAICIYGLSQSNSIFVGLADTECSLLKFIGEALDGETKESKPKWIGISGIKNIFVDTKSQIEGLNEDTRIRLEEDKNSVSRKKSSFETSMETYSVNIFNKPRYKRNINSFSDSNKNGEYKLDIVYNFGKFDKETKTATDNSFMKAWYIEYQETSREAEGFMDTIYENYRELSSNTEATGALDEGIKSIGELQSSFDEVKDLVSGIIVDYSDTIDKYGKLIFKIVFSVLMAIDLGIAAFISLLFFCKFPVCQNGCLKCLLKSLIHILWNILALLTFLTLLIGSLFTLLGTVGKDLISVVEYLVSDDNLNKPEPALLGEAADYLKICVNDDGNITGALGLNLDSLDNINVLNNVSQRIDNAKTEADNLLQGKFAYNNYLTQYNNIKDYKVDNFTLIKSDKTNIFKFSEYISKINQLQTKIEWKTSCQSPTDCDLLTETSNNVCVEPKSCDTSIPTTVYSTETTNTYDVLNTFIILINEIKAHTSGLYIALDSLENAYTQFLRAETRALTTYKNSISSLTSIFDGILGEDGDIYSLLNCKFIGKNVKVILKYLNKSLGTNFYNLGVCLLVAGLAMCFSISFTILLNIIINTKDESQFDNNINEKYNTEKVNMADEFNGVDNANRDNPNNDGNLQGDIRIINYDS
jgi:energy-coupling factor transporter transmembrane protein EcfT